MSSTPGPGDGHPLAPGTAVEVHNGFTGGWTAGFEVERDGPEGYRLRRVSDASVLPGVFAADKIRAGCSTGSADGRRRWFRDQ